jgi:hypothetical protein
MTPMSLLRDVAHGRRLVEQASVILVYLGIATTFVIATLFFGTIWLLFW